MADPLLARSDGVIIARADGVSVTTACKDACCGPACEPWACGYDLPERATPSSIAFDLMRVTIGPWIMTIRNDEIFRSGGKLAYTHQFTLAELIDTIITPGQGRDELTRNVQYTGIHTLDESMMPSLSLQIYRTACAGVVSCQFIFLVSSRIRLPDILGPKLEYGPATWTQQGADRIGVPGVALATLWPGNEIFGSVGGSQVLQTFDPFGLGDWSLPPLLCDYQPAIDTPENAIDFETEPWGFTLIWDRCSGQGEGGGGGGAGAAAAESLDPAARAVLEQQVGGCTGCGG